MTFDARERSRSRAKPILLYRFSYQQQVFTYTNADQPVIVNSGAEDAPETYQPIAIDLPQAIVSSGTLEKNQIGIELPADNPVSLLFRVFPPSDAVSAVIFQTHIGEDETEFFAVFTGKIVSRKVQGAKATLQCEPASQTMKRPGLRRRYQYGCPHALYGPQCRADKAAFTRTVTVTSVSGGTIGFGSTWAGSFPEARFLNGLFAFTDDDGVKHVRTILRVNESPNTVVVSGAVPGLAPGRSVQISLGCNHQMDGCTIFSNIHNYGGMPWIPIENPIGFVNQFY